MFVRVRDIDIHVQATGGPGKPALLMLHSLGTTAHVWDTQADRLSGDFHVIRPDLRGHGLTTATQGPYSIAQLARDALDLLDVLGIRYAHVAGLSVGGMIAQSIAAQAPDLVLSLILCDTAMTLPPAQAWRDRATQVRSEGMASISDTVMARWVTPDFISSPAAMGLRTMLLRTDPEGYAATADAIAAADLTADTSALRVPTLILVGDQDLATPVQSAETLVAAIKGASLDLISEAAHISTVEAPDAVADSIAAFLSLQNTKV
jgi:3-oxoadipate enol-lactonase/4-carboxymuconolactone decarboxylase